MTKLFLKNAQSQLQNSNFHPKPSLIKIGFVLKLVSFQN